MTEKFGKVFVPKNDLEYEPIQLATFSNFDLKWYTLDGEIHPKYKVYKNSHFSLGYQMENLNKDGKREVYKGRLLLPIKLDEFGNGPDLEYLETFKKMERELAEKLELLDKDDEEQVARFSKSQAIMAFVLPEEKLWLQSPLLLYLSMAIMMDDLVDTDQDKDSSGFSDVLRQISYSQFIQMLQPGVLALEGKSSSLVRQAVNSSKFFLSNPNLGLHDALKLQRYENAYLRLAEGLRNEAMELAESENDAVHFLASVKQLFEVVCLDVCKEWNEVNNSTRELLKDAQIQLRKITGGMYVVVEAIALQLKIKLEPEVRQSFWVNWWLGELAYHAGKTNDLLSYNVEMERGNAENNEVYKLHKEQGLELNKALKRVEDDANLCMKRILKGEQILKQMFPGDKQLERYINVGKRVAMGIQSNCYITRWHSNITWDCYVESEDELLNTEIV